MRPINARQAPGSVLLTVAVLAAFAASPKSAGQEPPPDKVLIRRGPKLQSVGQFATQGPLLTFDLVAYDTKGVPFRNLRDVDLDIRDDGKPMPAVFCRPLETEERRSTPLGEYTNRPTAGHPPFTLVLLDLLNENVVERGVGWYDVVNTLSKVESPERLYLYLLTEDGALYPVRALPGSGHPASADDGGWVSQVRQQLDRAMHAVNSLRSQDLAVNVDARVHRTVNL